MKSLRLLAVALLACACTASFALACDAQKSNKTTAATASAKKTAGSVSATGGCSAKAIGYKTAAADHACTPEMAAQCTPEMHAACMSNASVAAAMGCPASGASKNTTTAVAASAKGKSAHGADCCAGMGSAATAAAHGKSKSAGMDHCAAGSAVTASAAGLKCSAHANAVAHDCSACEDWMGCEQEVNALGATAQVVPLKNGAMIVYTADSPTDVKALQTVIAKRHEKMVVALTAANGQKLCDECKSLRGAMASGKLHREVVNVERGCMTLLTSNDKTVVGKIRAMTGQPVAMR